MTYDDHTDCDNQLNKAEDALIALQAKYKALEASHEKREKRSSDCIIWHSKELSKVKRDNLRLRGKLEYMKKYSGYLRPDGHPHTHYHGGCIWCDIEQALKEAEKL